MSTNCEMSFYDHDKELEGALRREVDSWRLCPLHPWAVGFQMVEGVANPTSSSLTACYHREDRRVIILCIMLSRQATVFLYFLLSTSFRRLRRVIKAEYLRTAKSNVGSKDRGSLAMSLLHAGSGVYLL